MTRRFPRFLQILCLLVLTVTLMGLDGFRNSKKIRTPFSGGVIRVVALREPLSRSEPGQGYEYDLLLHFSQSRKATLKWTWASNPSEALQMIENDEADIAAGRWSLEALPWNHKGLVAAAYEESPAVLLCNKNKKLVSQEDATFLENWLLKDEKTTKGWIENKPLRIGIHNRDKSAELTQEITKINFDWKLEVRSVSSVILAQLVGRKELDCVVTDSITGQWLVDRFPWMQLTRTFDQQMTKTFLLNPKRPELERDYSSWLQLQNRNGKVTQIRERYFSYQKALVQQDRIRFLRARLVDLPELLPLFKRHAHEFKIPWQLLAAVAYQESHWDNEALSPTGVRGIMQLTSDTALHLGVEDREDLDQSIWGGAKYLRLLLDAQPSSLHPRDRIALALASYNVGIGHLKDAQKLAAAEGNDPFSFWDLRKSLPLLSDPAIAAGLTFGTARGDEPVQFTDRVLSFYELLSDRAEFH